MKRENVDREIQTVQLLRNRGAFPLCVQNVSEKKELLESNYKESLDNNIIKSHFLVNG